MVKSEDDYITAMYYRKSATKMHSEGEEFMERIILMLFKIPCRDDTKAFLLYLLDILRIGMI